MLTGTVPQCLAEAACRCWSNLNALRSNVALGSLGPHRTRLPHRADWAGRSLGTRRSLLAVQQLVVLLFKVLNVNVVLVHLVLEIVDSAKTQESSLIATSRRTRSEDKLT